ncbi:MAG: hypothetical protein BMS9Abin12_0332 [Acidimicrobiia bacterium]|nr:MAG: hypothetical protein BMS9Abin12_0332 [Acidimicrobiia bacterium]
MYVSAVENTGLTMIDDWLDMSRYRGPQWIGCSNLFRSRFSKGH